MTTWRPPSAIRPIVIGLAWNAGRLLVADVHDREGSLKGMRPLGGSIEFGETREEALHREFREELGVDIDIVGTWHLIENIFEFNGAKGHELVFVADIRVLDESILRREEMFTVETGHEQRVRWVDPESLDGRDIQIFPVGLSRLLQQQTS